MGDNGQHKQTKELEQSMAASQSQKSVREPLLTLVTTHVFVSHAAYQAFHLAVIYAMLQKDTTKYWKRYNCSLLYCSDGHTQSY